MPDLTHEAPSALSPLIRRVVAKNPSLMTGAGTNTYLVGVDEVAVIDPGPDLAKHVDAIVGASMRERVRWILLTHTHPDHWPAASKLRSKTGAQLCAFGSSPKADEFDLPLDRVLNDGDTVEGTEFLLEAIHTPGHAPNHLCYMLEEERVLFTGDHILNGTTTVVNPQRGGDMVQYMASLDRLRKMKRVARICPGHGDVMEAPATVFDEYVKHRKARERQIVKTLKAGPRTIKKIVAELYVDTPEGLLEMAAHQVHAHLLKLRAEGKVNGSGAKASWSLAE